MFRLRLRSLLLSGLLGLGLLSNLGACRPQLRVSAFDGAAAAEHAARLEDWLARHPDDARARLELAHVYWLHLADAEAAIPHLDQLTGLPEPPPLARFSRATIAQHRLDAARAWAEHEALLREAGDHGRASERELAMALSPYAARALDALEGLIPGDQERFEALFDALSPALEDGRYPGETAAQLLSTRASIARRLDQDYRPIYARQGCVQDWQVGVLEGYRGPLELSRLEVDRGFRADEDPAAAVTPLSCAVRVANVEPGAAIRRLRSTVELPPGESILRLTINTQYDARVYVDDQLVWASDRTDRYPADEPTFALPVGSGVHRLELRASVPSERAWVLVRATDSAGRPLEVRAGSQDVAQKGDFRLDTDPQTGRPLGIGADRYLERLPWRSGELGLRGPVYAPLREFLALADALDDGDPDAAEQIAEQLRLRSEGFADGHLLLADFEQRDPSRGRTASSARQQAELEAGLDLDPGLSHSRVSQLHLRMDRGELAEVIEELEALPAEGRSEGETLLLSLLRFDAYRRRGSDLLAERALERAAAAHPQNCEVLMARRELARERVQVEAEEQLVAALHSCPGSLGIRARLALGRERFDEARALWTEQLARIPDDLEAMEALASIAVAEGELEQAREWQRRMLELSPYRAVSLIALADLAAAAGSAGGGDPEAARELVQAAIDIFPYSTRLREIGERVGIEDELLRWRIDGQEALVEYRADLERGEAAEGVAEVLLLDREVSMLYADGGHRHIVHQMFHILSDQAIDAHGEFNQPGVSLLTMHSIKPDGTIVEPESIAGKEGLSLRGLAIDDVVEIEFIYESGPEPALPGHVDLGRFRFQSPELPFHRSELVALVPKSLESKVRVEARNSAPTPTRRELSLAAGEYSELSFSARKVPRLGAEPGSRSMMDELPMVQVHVPLVVEDWLDQLAAQLRPAQRSNPELRALAEEIGAQYSRDYDKVDALWRWVVDEIEEAGDLSTPATVTLSSRQGSRLMLLRALCQAAGVDSQLWLLRDRFGPEIYAGGDPLVESYDTAMLAVFPDGPEGTPVVIGTSSEVIPLGYLAPSYAGGQAVRLRLERDEPEPGYVEVPQNPAHLGDLRRWKLDIELDASGNGVLRGSLELRGLEAIQWRTALHQVDQERLPEIFTQAELGRLLPGAGIDLAQLEFENDWELELPLLMHFSARVRDAGVVQGKELVLLASAVPIDPATPYTRLPSRWSAMVIPYAPVLEAEVRYLLGGARFSEVPRDLELRSEWGSYSRSVSAGGAGQSELVLRSRSTLQAGIVEAEAYPQLAGFAAQIQSAEQQLLRAAR